jgi:hypothetical protein
MKNISGRLVIFLQKMLAFFGYKLSPLDFHDISLKSRSYLTKLSFENESSNSEKKIMPIKAHMFWAYGSLSKLEILSAVSFLKNGYELNFWSYDNISNLPDGVIQRDAREILPEHRVFKYKNGSYAGFANLFRYAVLLKYGGLWADSDVICLLPMSELQNSGIVSFLVTERTPSAIKLNNNLIYNSEPRSGDVIDLAYALSDRFDVDKLQWGDCGPKLLSALVKTYPSLIPTIMEPCFANPVDWWDCPRVLLDPKKGKEIPIQWGFLHCYNEMWRTAGIDKNSPFPPGSFLSKIQSLDV